MENDISKPSSLICHNVPEPNELMDYLVHNQCIHDITQSGLTLDENRLEQIEAADMQLVLIPERIDPESLYDEIYNDYDDNEDPKSKFLLDNQSPTSSTCDYVVRLGNNRGCRCTRDKVNGYDYCVGHLRQAGCKKEKLN